MTFNRQSYDNRGGGQPFGSITAIVISLAVLVVLFFLARFVFNILYYLSPIFLIATLVIDYKVVWDYLKWVRNLYRRDIIIGIGATILSIFGFPILSAFLFGKALFRKRVKDAAKQAKEYHEGKLIEYEEIDDEALDLKRLKEQTRRREQERSSRPSSRDDSSDEYEDLFE